MHVRQAHRVCQLAHLPRLDRFFPNCLLGAVELVARFSFGFADIKKCWFGNTIVYSAPTSGWVAANGFEFTGRIAVAQEAHCRALARLEEYYGIQIAAERLASVEDALDSIYACLDSGKPAISSFELSLLDSRRPQGQFRPHYSVVGGIDFDRGFLRVLDSAQGEHQITFDRFALGFERYTQHDMAFEIVRPACESPGSSRSLQRSQAGADVARSLENLESDDPTRGLSALRRCIVDVERAHADLGRPFYVPGLWIFSHDRNCFRRALPYWREAALVPPRLLERLDGQLTRAFEIWFQADMTIERSITEGDGAQMREVPRILQRVVPIEVEISESLRSMLRYLITESA